MRRNAFIAILIAFALLPVRGQQPSTPKPPPQWPTGNPVSPARQEPPPSLDQEDIVRITTNLVQIDAVVTKGDKQVTDLTAQDFEIFEDGRPQTITNLSYISTIPKSTEAAIVPANPAADKNAPVIPPPPLRVDNAHRTIALVVDDLGISMESMGAIRKQLRKFIEEEMQPSDLVAIIRTGSEVGALQQFTNDKRLLTRAIDNVKWNHCSRSGISIFAAAGADTSAKGGDNGVGLCSEMGNPLLGTMAALRFVLQGMREIPGRKSMVIFSENMPSDIPDDALQSGPIRPVQVGDEPTFRGGSVFNNEAALRRLAELAIRASVVIYGVDTRGLQPVGPTAAENTRPNLYPTGSQPFDMQMTRIHALQDARTGQDLLARETGGFLVKNTNDFSLKRIAQDQSGYYLLAYRPTGATFNRRFHKISVRVKRPGLAVRTRSGFFGVTDEQAQPAQFNSHDRINVALMSPFRASDLEVHLTAIFANVAAKHSLIRSLVHFDGASLTFADEADGWHKATLNLAGVVFGDNGRVIQQVAETRALRVHGNEYDRVLREGLVYQFDVSVNRPGAYQFRVAVRDDASGRIGTARQFVEVPDLSKHHVALSGVTVFGDSHALKPETQASNNMSSSAVRRFVAGSNLLFGYVVYNAQLDNTTRAPNVLAQARIFREGKLVYTGQQTPIDLAGQTDLERIRAAGGIRLGTALEPGEYILQVLVTDAAAKEKYATATQWIDFEIVK